MDLDLNSSLAVIAAAGAVAAAAAAIVTAWATHKIAKANRDAVRMAVLLDFSRRDASPEMGRSIQRLWAFARAGSLDSVEQRFRALRASEDPNDEAQFAEIDEARRIVHKFYLQLMQAKQALLFTERELVIGMYKHQLSTIVDVLEPLERAKPGAPYTKLVFAEYRRLY